MAGFWLACSTTVRLNWFATNETLLCPSKVLLAVIDRELRTSARKPATWRIRIIVPGLAFLFSAFALWVVTLFGGTPIPGPDLYLALTWISFGCAMLIGASLTADAVSAEKREGTLGLLFLTPLKGYQIALGKFFSSGITCVYALVAVFPIMAIPLLMGGVGPREFLFTLLALLVSTLLALSLGLFFSTVVTQPWKAVGLSLFATLGFTGLIPALSEFVRQEYHRPDLAQFILTLSPAYAVYVAGATAWRLNFQQFWQSVFLLSGITIFLLIAISLLLPHVWKDRPGSRLTLRLRTCFSRWRYGAGLHRQTLRTRLLQLNPFTWLASRQRWASSGFVLFGFALFVGALTLSRKLVNTPGSEEEIVLPFAFTFGVVAFLYLGLTFRLAILACDRFSTDRKSGALELLLSSPLSVKEIVRGQWLALARHLWAGILLSILAHAYAMSWAAELIELESGRPVSLRVCFHLIYAHLTGQEVGWGWEPALIPHLPLLALPFLIYSWVGLGWLSMWLGLRMAVQIRAPWFAVLLIFVPPWPVFAAIMGVMEHNKWLPSHDFSTFLLGAFLAGCLVFLNITLWIWWARRQIRFRFRTAATDRFSLTQSRSWFKRLLLGRPQTEQFPS